MSIAMASQSLHHYVPVRMIVYNGKYTKFGLASATLHKHGPLEPLSAQLSRDGAQKAGHADLLRGRTRVVRRREFASEQSGKETNFANHLEDLEK
jgi:hypothetical protein